jgi:hypothetical protein
MPGSNISQAETAGQSQITSIEIDGFWLLTGEGEYFVSFEDYPEFREASVKQIFNFDQAFDHFHWLDLDIDIELEALQHPERFPLKFKR